MEQVINRIEETSRETLNFWKDTTKWAPDYLHEEPIIPDLERYIQLTNFLQIWNIKNNGDNIESFYLAYALLAELTEGWIRLAYSIYFAHSKADCIKLLEPDKISFNDLKKFAKGRLYKENSDIDKFVKRTKNFLEYIKKEEKSNNLNLLGIVINFYSDLIIYQDFIEEIDIRLPYPDR